MTQAEFFAYVIDVLEELKILYMVTGSIASIAYGEPRLTYDMDIVTDLSPAQARQLVEKFDSDYHADLDSIIQAIREKGHFNIIHVPSGSKVDFFLLKSDAFKKEQFSRKRKEAFDETRFAFFATPEDVVINKLEYYQQGQSEKHLEDIRGMLRISQERLDIKYIDYQAQRLGLTSVWNKVKKETGIA